MDSRILKVSICILLKHLSGCGDGNIMFSQNYVFHYILTIQNTSIVDKLFD
jgi:hypothetical protein